MWQHSNIRTESHSNGDLPVIATEDEEDEKERTTNNNKSITFEDDGCDEVRHEFSLMNRYCESKKHKRRSALTILFAHSRSLASVV